MGSTTGERMSHDWYARPVLFVTDLQGAIRFYDPDGNEIFSPLDETNDRERQKR